METWFSILQRRVIRYGDFENQDAQKERVEGFIRHRNHFDRHPLRWT